MKIDLPQRLRAPKPAHAAWAALVILCLTPAFGRDPQPASHPGLDPILKYIGTGWDTLTRSMTDCNTVVDPKLAEESILYLPAGLTTPDSVREMQDRCHIKVEHLPATITGPGQISTNITPPGLLYLPNKYVVPGGRFNEMYGWDTYFIVRGLVEDKRFALARGIIENFFFEIEHYGTVLNANRTYFLTRSQPPFLTSMILSVYEAEKAGGKDDRELLEQGYQWASKDYEMWNREPHLAGDTGLSRYFDFGNGPAPESLKDETDAYRRVAGYFLLNAQGRNYITEVNEPQAAQSPEEQRKAAAAHVGARYSVQVCNAQRTMAKADCETPRDIFLTAEYYKGDRAMRESGFDIAFRFGPYGAATHHYAPVCLNSLLYKTEKDLQQISEMLGRRDDAKRWADRASQRAELVQKLLWDAQKGMYFDYNLDSSARSTYNYITTFYPLWVGIATREQAEALRKNLPTFEHLGGLAMSDVDAGVQWDLPFGWAPTQLIAIEGFRKYGFNEDAERTSYEFLSTVAENFRRDGTIREKYDVITRSSDTPIATGYNQNVVGFGWTNGAFLVLLHKLPADMVTKLANEQTAPAKNP
jgi:alpha,alpha-trehalase